MRVCFAHQSLKVLELQACVPIKDLEEHFVEMCSNKYMAGTKCTLSINDPIDRLINVRLGNISAIRWQVKGTCMLYRIS